MRGWLTHYARGFNILLMLLLFSLESDLSSAESNTADKNSQMVDGYRVLEWTDLMPKDDLEALLNPPEYLNDIVDGSIEDQLDNQVQVAIEQASDSRYQQALVSTRIVPSLEGQAVRVPGFIVPFEFGDERQEVTRFFLVPYYGACLHLPPPPPNQIIHAQYVEGFKVDSFFEPFWLSGVLRTSLTENDVATSAYTIKVDRIEIYDE